MNSLNRREFLFSGVAGLATLLAGCGGSEDLATAVSAPLPPVSPSPTPNPSPSPPAQTPPAPTPAPPPAVPGPPPPGWSPIVPPLIVGSGATFDLASTLPMSVARGGVFGVDLAGVRLPSGMTLSANGILAVGSATVGSVANVVFSYDVP